MPLVNKLILRQDKKRNRCGGLLLLIVIAILFLFLLNWVIYPDTHAIEYNLMPSIADAGYTNRFHIRKRMAHYHVPGLSLAIIDGGQIVYKKGYGIANTNDRTSVGINTLFQIGSVGKTIAALTVLSLVNKGVLNLDKDIRTYLKSWKLPVNNISIKYKVNLRHLLSHTSGFNDDYSAPFSRKKELPSLSEHLRNSRFSVFRTPGEAYFYSGVNYMVIEQIIEDVTGQAYSVVAAKEVLKPLGMKHTHFYRILPKKMLRRSAFAHRKDGRIYPDYYPVYPAFAPGTCNWSTAEDLAKLYLELERSFYGKSNKIIPQSLTRTMIHNHSGAYGLGIKRIVQGKHVFIGHSGDFYGFHACIYGYLGQGKGVVVLTNGDNGVKLYNEIIRSVAHVYRWSGCRPEIIRGGAANFKSLTGCYLLDAKRDIINIYQKNNYYFADLFGMTGRRLHPVSADVFYNHDIDGFLKFNTDSIGKKNIIITRIGVMLPGNRQSDFDGLFHSGFDMTLNGIKKKTTEYRSMPYYETIFFNIGYYLLEGYSLDHACRFFRLAVRIYPGSSYLNYGLGDALLKNGEPAKARTFFYQAKVLNPTNTYAKEMLNHIKQKYGL